MRDTPWKALFISSLLLAAAGGGLFLWGIVRDVGWMGAMVGVFVLAIGSLLARMNYRALRYAEAPGPGTAFPIIGVCACAFVWIAIIVTRH